MLCSLRYYCAYSFEHYITCLHKAGGQTYSGDYGKCLMCNAQCTAGKVISEGVRMTENFLWQIPSMVLEAVDVMYTVALVLEVFSCEVNNEA